MPEMFYTSEAISSDKELGKSIALITDGRFSGASTGDVYKRQVLKQSMPKSLIQ